MSALVALGVGNLMQRRRAGAAALDGVDERPAAPLVAMVIGPQLRRLATGTPAASAPTAGQEPADPQRAEA